uniref:Uncharacterized protein n=1 Tax=viral metagenome TaxID=1070528 RepID=A0A6H1ZPZ8_9ZZZZ
MATIKEWQDDLKTKEIEELRVYYNALSTLDEWDLFREEHPYMGILRIMVYDARVNKEVEKEEMIECPEG